MKKGILNLTGTIPFLLMIILQCTGLFAQQGDYPIQPVPFTAVTIEDNFWAPKIKTNHEVTIPYGFKQSADRILNFEVAAGLKPGNFATDYPFDDTDIYKLIEGASYSLHYYPDVKLESYIDSLIEIVGKAQEPDGYLYTTRTIAEKNGTKPHEWSGDKRWVNEHILSHELYNLGHLFESAVAYYQATGKKSLLNIAIKAADRIDQDFGWGKIEDYPGHQIVETGLARLYRTTGDERYLNLAKFFLDVRGPGGEEYCQADKKVVEQTQAVGHSVRAVYMYAGMADIAALKNDPSYITAIDKIWDDIVTTKTYVTGGIGASGGNEGFNGAFNLPNETAYCETCASIGNVYLNHRLFLLHGDAKYIDMLERTLYNALLSGVSLSGDRFFYPNVLRSSGKQQRSEWFGCACCPPNVTRLIPSVPGYFYAINGDQVYVNLFAQNTAHLTINGNQVELRQKTGYPWDGNIEITVNPAVKKTFTLMLRIPGWVRNEALPGNLYRFADSGNTASYSLTVNGKTISPEIVKGYAAISRNWKKGDKIILSLPMTPRTITADPRVKADSQQIAIQRGPMIYCAEGAGNGDNLFDLQFHPQFMPLNARFDPMLLGGTEVIETTATDTDGSKPRPVILIPYFLWNNRGKSEMEVWLPIQTVRP